MHDETEVVLGMRRPWATVLDLVFLFHLTSGPRAASATQSRRQGFTALLLQDRDCLQMEGLGEEVDHVQLCQPVAGVYHCLEIASQS